MNGLPSQVRGKQIIEWSKLTTVWVRKSCRIHVAHLQIFQPILHWRETVHSLFLLRAKYFKQYHFLWFGWYLFANPSLLMIIIMTCIACGQVPDWAIGCKKQASSASREWPLSACSACHFFLSSPGACSQANICIASKFASVDAYVSLIQSFYQSRVWMTRHLKLCNEHQVTLWWIGKLMGGRQANSLFVRREKWKARLKTKLSTQLEATSESESIDLWFWNLEPKEGRCIQMLQML